MEWQQPPEEPLPTVIFGNAEAERIANELLADFTQKMSGRLVPGGLYKDIRNYANTGAIRGFIAGYTRACEEIRAGQTPVTLFRVDVPVDQR